MLRSVALIAALFLLCVGIALIWQHRFESVDDQPAVALDSLVPISTRATELVHDGHDGGSRIIRMEATAPGTAQVALFDLAPQPPPEFLHVRIHALSKNLVPDEGSWQNGRTIIEWHDIDGVHNVVYQPIHSAQFDSMDEPHPFVLECPYQGAVPRLRIENLGREGTYELRELVLQPVRERYLWRIASPLLVSCWLVWVVALCRQNKKPAWWRGFLSGMVFIAMGLTLAIPGPWKVFRPLGFEFNLNQNENSKPDKAVDSIQATIKLAYPPLAPQPLGKMEVQGGILIQIKFYLSMIRPLLHGALFLGPAFVLAWLVGKKSSIMLMTLITFGIETSQLLFGYGFDPLDVMDILCDLAGISAGIWIYSRSSSGIHRRLTRHFPQPA